MKKAGKMEHKRRRSILSILANQADSDEWNWVALYTPHRKSGLLRVSIYGAHIFLPASHRVLRRELKRWAKRKTQINSQMLINLPSMEFEIVFIPTRPSIFYSIHVRHHVRHLPSVSIFFGFSGSSPLLSSLISDAPNNVTPHTHALFNWVTKRERKVFFFCFVYVRAWEKSKMSCSFSFIKITRTLYSTRFVEINQPSVSGKVESISHLSHFP